MIQNPDVVIIGGRFGWAICRTLMNRHPDWHFSFIMRDEQKVNQARQTGKVSAFFDEKIKAAGRLDLDKKIRLTGKIEFHTLSDFNRHFRGKIKRLFIPAVPSSNMRKALELMRKAGVPLTAFKACETLAVSKGMETQSLLFPHEIIDKTLNTNSVVALGGNLAFDFAIQDPMLVEIAGYPRNTRRIARFFAGSNLILYQTRNRRKLSLAGPMKNIHSLATGMASEIYGSSSVSTVATLGLSEYERAAFIVQFRKNLQPLARMIRKIPFHFRSVPIDGGAMSDYHLFRFTRNFSAGQQLVKKMAKGRTARQAMEIITRSKTIESFSSAAPTNTFLKSLGCYSPVIEITARILSGKSDPASGIARMIRQKNLFS